MSFKPPFLEISGRVGAQAEEDGTSTLNMYDRSLGRSFYLRLGIFLVLLLAVNWLGLLICD